MNKLAGIRFLTIIALFMAHALSAQQDSLLRALEGEDNERKQIAILNRLAERYMESDAEQSWGYLSSALGKLAESKADIEAGMTYRNKGIYEDLYGNRDSSLADLQRSATIFDELGKDYQRAISLYRLARVYFKADKYPEALEAAQLAKNIFERELRSERLAETLLLICDIQSHMGSNDRAIDYCISALSIYNDLEKDRGKTRIYNAIGRIYFDLRNPQKAEQYYTQALDLSRRQSDTFMIGESLTNLGEVYLQLDQYQQALQFYRMSLSIDQKLKDPWGTAYSLYYLGITYIEVDKLDSAQALLDSAYQVALATDNLDLQARIQLGLGNIKSERGQFKDAIRLHKNALVIGQKINASPILKSCYQELAKYYDKLGDKTNALIYLNLYIEHSEEMFSQQIARKVAEAEASYDLKVKQNQIDLLQAENEIQMLEANRRQLFLFLLSAGLIIVIIFSIIFYNQYRLKSRSNRKLQEQRDAINSQKEKLQEQRDAIEEKNRQITDSIEYARKLQVSLMPDLESLRRFFPESFVLYLPKDVVSGDFFWIAEGETHITLAVVDCTGHGVPGAFMTVLSKNIMDQINTDFPDLSPSKLLHKLDQRLRKALNQEGLGGITDDGLVAGVVQFEKGGNTLTYSGSRISMFVYSDQELQEIKPVKRTLGIKDDQKGNFEDHEFTSENLDELFIATDGFQDQFGKETDKKYLKSRFKKFLKRLGAHPAKKQYKLLLQEHLDWKKDVQQTDDILVLGIKP